GLLARLGQVAAVGAEHGPVLAVRTISRVDQQGRVGTGETGEVADVEQIGHEHRVQLALPEQVAKGVAATDVRFWHVSQPNRGKPAKPALGAQPAESRQRARAEMSDPRATVRA